jgi:hypothetical protein
MQSLVPVDYRICCEKVGMRVAAVDLGEGCNEDWVRLMMRSLDLLELWGYAQLLLHQASVSSSLFDRHGGFLRGRIPYSLVDIYGRAAIKCQHYPVIWLN